MKSIGIVRQIDEIGRVVIPKKFRKELNIVKETNVDIFTKDDCIILRKIEPSDVFTGETADLVEYKKKMISKATIIKLCEIAGIKIQK